MIGGKEAAVKLQRGERKRECIPEEGLTRKESTRRELTKSNASHGKSFDRVGGGGTVGNEKKTRGSRGTRRDTMMNDDDDHGAGDGNGNRGRVYCKLSFSLSLSLSCFLPRAN